MDLFNGIRKQRFFCMLIATLTFVWSGLLAHSSFAQQVKIGRTTGGSGFHIPSDSLWVGAGASNTLLIRS